MIAPSTEQWEAHRATITQLYAEHKLKDVQHVMRSVYGFEASKRMYDRRLKTLGISKNLKSEREDENINMLLEAQNRNERIFDTEIQALSFDPQLRAKLKRYALSQERNNIDDPELSFRGSDPNRREARLYESDWSDSSDTSSPNDMDLWNMVSPAVANGVYQLEISKNYGDAPSHGQNRVESAHKAHYKSLSGKTMGKMNLADDKNAEHNLAEDKSSLHFSPMPQGLDPALYSIPGPLQTATIDVERLLLNINHLFQSDHVLGNVTRDGNLPNPSKCFIAEPCFWTELKHGIYLLKVGSQDLAWPAINKACTVAPIMVAGRARSDLDCLRELFLTLSPLNMRDHPGLRTSLLQYIGTLAHSRLHADHPLFHICHQLQQDGHTREVSELALECLLGCIIMYQDTAIKFAPRELQDLAFRVECARIRLLRRDGRLDSASVKAKSLLDRSKSLLNHQATNPVSVDVVSGQQALQQARLAARELVHVEIERLDQSNYQAIEHNLFVLTGSKRGPTPGNNFDLLVSMLAFHDDNVIEDKISVYAMEDMAKICEESGKSELAFQWLMSAKSLAEKVLAAGENDTATKHISQKLARLQGQQ